MKRRLLIGTALAGVCAVLVMTVIVRAATVTLTKLPATYFDQPVGIDWQPTTNELLVSYNWPTGSPNTFERVNRVTGAAAPLGSVSGYTDEVYFATVRPGAGAQAAGWQVGDIYSGKGAGDFTHLARLGPAGNVINATFGNMPEALVPGVGTGGKLKRGGVEFDRFGVAGYDLIVVASNDNGVSPLGSVLYRINSAGVTVKLAEVPNVHLEGITTVPYDAATYGPFAGKILVGEEVGANIYVFDPNTSPNQNPVIVPVALPNGDPIKVEDLWIIPPNSAFYGVDCFNCDAGGSSKIWTAPSSEWTSYVGQLLVAQEYSAQLYLVK